MAFRGGFHGRTAFALSTTWQPGYREPFEPLVPGVRFGDYNRLEGLDRLLDERVAAVIVEPVQGEAGAVPATAGFLAALRARTSALGAALILDEVQSGMGRCGRLLAQEHFGVRGDLTVLMRKEDGKLRALIEILSKNKTISEKEKQQILSLEPFPQLFSPK